tara:strand:+ start:13162 stop:14229 length:1068 start_codon:yes stop_codon:yes gene_type:complete
MRRLPPKNGVKFEKINTLLVDGNALFKRGYLGSPDALNENGDHVGGIYQFITVLKKLLLKDVFHKVYVFWDGNFSGKLRWEIYSDYKSDRGKDYQNGTEPDDINEKLQQFIVKGYLHDLSIRQLTDEVIEADDFIAFYCLSKLENEHITICTSDRDICQLITDDIKIYLCDKKEYVTVKNYNDYFEHQHENVALIKQIGGDNSDSIVGIKGVKEPTLLKYFPILKERKCTLKEILEEAQRIQDERATNKKKPLKALTNILESITDGVQGKAIYEVNDQLVNLTKPMLTRSGIEDFYAMLEEPLSDDRDIKNVYKMMERDGVDQLLSEYYMTDYFLPFKKLIDREKRMTNKQQLES